MTRTYKYQALYSYFEQMNLNYVKLTYQEIENILGFKLPDSAYEYIAYWHPSKTHTICRSWVENGFKMVHVSLENYVEFERIEAVKSSLPKVYKIEVYLSKDLIPKIIEETTRLGAGKVGGYDHVASYYEIEGCWRPLGESPPFTGEKNQVNYGKEYKLELRCEEIYVRNVLKRIREIHPYEEALINVIRLENYKFE